MAINPDVAFPGKTAGVSPEYPYGKARDVSAPGDGTGTPLRAAWVNDWFGLQQQLLSLAGITPSGVADAVGACQVWDALQALLVSKVALAAEDASGDIGFVQSGAASVARTVEGRLREFMSVLDKGADPAGIANSSAAFNTAGSEAYLALVPEGVYLLNTVPAGRFLLLGNAKLKGAGAAGCKAMRLAELPVFAPQASDNGFKSTVQDQSAIMVLGDSITAATGAGGYTNGYSFQLARSIMNAIDNGFGNAPGYGWHSDLPQALATFEGFASNGSIVAAGIANSRRSLAAGQTITVTQRAFNSVYVTYHGPSSSGSLTIAKNGVTLSTQAVSGAGLNTTAEVKDEFVESDTLTITATGGTVVVCNVLTLKTSAISPLVYVSGWSGSAYQDYTTTGMLDEIGYHLNLLRGGQRKTLVLALGTNNIYNAGKALSPPALIAKISELITGVLARAPLTKFVLSVPPKADESIFPVISPGVAYQDYVDAIVEFAFANQHGLIRNDKSILSRSPAYYADGIHPNADGHRIMAQVFCESFGIKFNPYRRLALPFGSTVVPPIAPWGAFSGNPALTLHATKQGNVLTLSGILQPNGASSTDSATLPIGMRPVGRTCFLLGRDNVGPVLVSILPSGVITAPTTSSWVSFEGVSFVINRS